MKKFRIYLIVFVSTIFLCFCVETEVYVDYVIINDSSYDIKLDRFYTYGADYLTDSIIERNSFLSTQKFSRGSSFSSIRDEENYVLEESMESYRKYTYTFTNADVEEAMQINLSQ